MTADWTFEAWTLFAASLAVFSVVMTWRVSLVVEFCMILMFGPFHQTGRSMAMERKER